jgi:hypothetical protein
LAGRLANAMQENRQMPCRLDLLQNDQAECRFPA